MVAHHAGVTPDAAIRRLRYVLSQRGGRSCALSRMVHGVALPRRDTVRGGASGAQQPATHGLVPRYWRRQLAEAARAAEPEPEPFDEASAEPAHTVDEATAALRHRLVEAALEDSNASRHGRHLVELLVAVVGIGIVIAVVTALASL